MAEAKPATAVTKAAAPRKARRPSHPPYLEMIGEAITALEERTGSSQYAIGKFIADKHKNKLPPNFAKVLLVQLRKFTASGKLIKIKNSYKLPSVRKTGAVVAKPKSKASGKVTTPKKKKKKVVSGLRKRKSVKSIGKSPVKKAAAKKTRK
ncbi:putative linker histone H1/H5, domain H15, winged helix-like DNA-binding domain superfamily [Dioscorea sansibarensis]